MANNKKRPGSAGTPLRAEDKQTHTNVTTNPVYKRTTSAPGGQLHIADYLSRGRGSAITRRELERLTNLDGRSVRLLIERERREGVPILSGHNGYFLPGSEAEKAACVRSLRHRAGEIFATARAVENGNYD